MYKIEVWSTIPPFSFSQKDRNTLIWGQMYMQIIKKAKKERPIKKSKKEGKVWMLLYDGLF